MPFCSVRRQTMPKTGRSHTGSSQSFCSSCLQIAFDSSEELVKFTGMSWSLSGFQSV